jgi:hypothetical protein
LLKVSEEGMLSLQESVTIFAQDHSPQEGDAPPRHRVLSQFLQARRQGQWRRLLNRLAGQPTRLRDLSIDLQHMPVKARHDAGLHSIPLDCIRGSEGRSQEFDADFYPLAAHNDERWISVAAAAQAGLVLPPVDLIQLGDLYYVRDGHHRVSVARHFGQKAIDAQVTVWQV